MELDIKIKDAKATVLSKADDGTVSSKIVSVTQLCQALSSVNKSAKIVVPEGCRIVYEKRDMRMFVFIRPPFIGDAALRWGRGESERYGDFANLKPVEGSPYYRRDPADNRGLRVFKIPYPATAIAVVTKIMGNQQYAFRNMYCYTLTNYALPTARQSLFYWPFTNVYGDNHVCIGDIPNIYPTIESIASIPKFMFNGISNHDLEAGGERLNRSADVAGIGKVQRGYDLIVALHEKSTFPNEYLRSAGSFDSTFDNIAENLR